MPEFIYHCPHCGQKMECDSEQFDGTVIATCPKCNQEICPEDSGEKPQPEIIKLLTLNTSKKQMRNFVYECPFCKQKYECDESWIGAKIECQSCGKESVVRKPGKSIKIRQWIPVIVIAIIVIDVIGAFVFLQNNNRLSIWIKSIFDDTVKDDYGFVQEKMFNVTGERTLNWSEINMSGLEPKFSHKPTDNSWPDDLRIAKIKMVNSFLRWKKLREESVKLFNKAMQIAVKIRPFDTENKSAASCCVQYYHDEKTDTTKNKVPGILYLECNIDSTKDKNTADCILVMKMDNSDDEVKLPFFVFRKDDRMQDGILAFSINFAIKMLSMRNRAIDTSSKSKTDTTEMQICEYGGVEYGASVSIQYNMGEKRPFEIKIHNQCKGQNKKYTLLLTKKNFIKIAEAVAVMENMVCEHNIAFANIQDFYQIKK